MQRPFSVLGLRVGVDLSPVDFCCCCCFQSLSVAFLFAASCFVFIHSVLTYFPLLNCSEAVIAQMVEYAFGALKRLPVA